LHDDQHPVAGLQDGVRAREYHGRSAQNRRDAGVRKHLARWPRLDLLAHPRAFRRKQADDKFRTVREFERETCLQQGREVQVREVGRKRKIAAVE